MGVALLMRVHRTAHSDFMARHWIHQEKSATDALRNATANASRILASSARLGFLVPFSMRLIMGREQPVSAARRFLESPTPTRSDLKSPAAMGTTSTLVSGRRCKNERRRASFSG